MIKPKQKLNIILIILIGVLYWPLAIIWVFLYGIIGGFFYKLWASIETTQFMIHKEYIRWKKHPKRAYEDYISLKSSIKNYNKKADYFWLNTRNELYRRYPTQFFPIFVFFYIIAANLILAPFRCITGMLEGPIFLFLNCVEFFQVNVLGYEPQNEYEQYLKNERLIMQGKFDWEKEKELSPDGAVRKDILH